MAQVRSGRSIATFDLHGPLFTGDPMKTVNENAAIMLEAVAKAGEEDVRAQIPVVTGETRAGVVGRTRKLDGGPFKTPQAVISQQRVFPWKIHGQRGFQGRAQAEYRGGKLEARVHMFRKTANRLRRIRKFNVAELFKGLQ